MIIIFFSFIKYFKFTVFNINLSLNYNKFHYLRKKTLHFTDNLTYKLNCVLNINVSISI